MGNKIGYPDKPVATLTEDLFNVEAYVNALCSFIKSCDTPMTVSIQGDWGSGKTSMMNMMKANMMSHVWPIWFNTWQFSQFDLGNSLAFSMMDVLLKGLDCDKNLRKQIINGLIGFGKKAIRVVTDTAIGGEFSGAVGDLMDGDTNTDYASEIMELKNKFQAAVNDKLEKEGKDRVVVFVDDLDRLQPSKAVELLEVLKLYLDCEKCVFVLAVDYEVVTLGIRQKFGNDVSDEKGRSFFDKIIQLPFKMPVASYDIHKYVRDMMSRINVSTDEKEVSLFYNLIQTSIGFNPRSMKRLFNTYELLDLVTESTVRNIENNVRRRILFAIICAQMCYEKLYLYFASTRIDELTFVDFQDDNKIHEAVKEIYGLDKDDDNTPEIERICSFIPHFIAALQVDEDYSLSEDELNNFKAILKCSVVTSVNATTDDSDNEGRDWEYRNRNKDLVKETIDKISDVGKFSLWMPRKEREGVKFSDASGWISLDTKAGFCCTLEFYLSKTGDAGIGASFFVNLSNGKGLESLFFKAMGTNPLKLDQIPQTWESGRYGYSNVYRFNFSDSTASDQIAKMTRSAYKSLNDTINEYVGSQI